MLESANVFLSRLDLVKKIIGGGTDYEESPRIGRADCEGGTSLGQESQVSVSHPEHYQELLRPRAQGEL